MALTQNFNVNPYYDDYDDTKGYNRVLFRPGYAVQARELTQLQTMMQKQIERFGSHIFKEGSMVLGGQTNYENTGVNYLKLQDTDTIGATVNVSNFVGKFIKKVGSNDVRAFVLIADEKTTTDPKTFALKYLSSVTFADGDDIEDESGDFTARAAVSSSSGSTSIVTVNEGVFFINGFFAKVNTQTIFLDKYSTLPTYRIGLEVSDTIVDETSDTSLLDPALDASNYQAPGATRLKIELTLAKRSLASTDDSKFIDILQVENGLIKSRNVYPQYSIIEDTLARRTFDESGNYTVRPFNVTFRDDIISNNGVGFANAFNIVISPGKAYVKGYEFETISPTVLVAERSRASESQSNYGLTLNYQNYVDITNISGPIDLDELKPLEIHCVPKQSINTTSTSTISATKIGTIRIRALDYQYGANTTSTSNAVFRAYVFDPNIGTITANATGGTANSITLHAGAATQNDAYYGVKLRIVNRSSNTAQTEIKTIQSYNGTTKVATFDSNWLFGAPNVNTIFSLDFEFKDAESFVLTNGSTTLSTSINISEDSKFSILTDDYQGAYITETQFESLIFPFPEEFIKEDSITNNEYFGRKVYEGTFTSAGVFGSAGGFSTGTGITSAVNGTPLSATDAIDNFFVVLTSAGSTTANNSVINFLQSNNKVSVTTVSNSSTVIMTCPGANNATATVYMKVKLPYPEELPSGTPIRKVKTQQVANTIVVSTTGGENIDGANVVLFNAETDQPGLQLNVAKDFTANLRNPALSQSLYISDVYNLDKVLDFGNLTANTTNIGSAKDITDSFELYDGQTVSAYNHSYIKIKPGFQQPTGNVVIYASYYSHSGTGYFSVDSYIEGGTEYKDIPFFTPEGSDEICLGDVIDFRPKLKNGLSGLSGEYEETIIGTSGTNFETDFAYYFPRIDKLVVTKDRKFEVIQGAPSFAPKPPPDRNDAMTLYTLILPPFVMSPAEIVARYVDNRRYTMRDIGELDQRIQNLEYFTTLNFLERTAIEETFIDDTSGLPRVKTGVIADPFKNFNIADTINEDYNALVDLNEGSISAPVATSPHSFEVGSGTGFTQTSTVISPSYTSGSFIRQPSATSVISINPQGANFSLTGGVTIDPTPVFPDKLQPPEDINSNPDNINGNWNSCLLTFDSRKRRKQLDNLLREIRKESKLTSDQISNETIQQYVNRKYKWGYRCYTGEWKWWETRIRRKDDDHDNDKDDDKAKQPLNTEQQFPVAASFSISENSGTSTSNTFDKIFRDDGKSRIKRRKR